MDTPKTLLQAVRYFASPDTCEEFMREIKWHGNEPTCPQCGSEVSWPDHVTTPKFNVDCDIREQENAD